MEWFSEVQEINKWEALWIKIQLHDLEVFRQKNQGGLALETLSERAEEDRTGVERNAREARDGRNPDTGIGSKISRGWMKSKEIRDLSERLQRKRSRTAP